MQTKMPSSEVKAIKLLRLCNAFKNCKESTEYANYCWKLAYSLNVNRKVHYSTFDQGYSFQDLVGLEIENLSPGSLLTHAYATISINDLSNLEVANVFKNNPAINQDVKPNTKYMGSYDWRNLKKELIFLMLANYVDDLYSLDESHNIDNLPKNPVLLNNDFGTWNTPVHKSEFHQWYSYKDYTFKSWSTLSGIFTPIKASMNKDNISEIKFTNEFEAWWVTMHETKASKEIAYAAWCHQQTKINELEEEVSHLFYL